MLGTVCRAWIGISLAAALAAHAEEAAVHNSKRIILDTDMTFDVDDVGALAVLHALADAGQATILAVYRGPFADPDASRYLDHVAAFPHRLTYDLAPDALDVYRRVLMGQPDHSVTIVGVGFLNNLARLLRAETDLVAGKVEKLVIMGGRHNDGFNLVRHDLVETTQEVIENWPTPLAISDFGGHLHTGASLEETPPGNPVREAYYRWFGKSFKGRSSWDQVAVLYGAGDWFEDVASGTGSLRNGYSWQLKSGWRTYVGPKRTKDEFEGLVERLMVEPPRN